MLDQDRARRSSAQRSMPPTTVSPVAAPSIRPAARWLQTSGPGTSRRPSSAKTSTAVRVAEADAAFLLGQAQREDAHLGELAPERAVEALRLLELGEAFVRDLAFARSCECLRAAPSGLRSVGNPRSLLASRPSRPAVGRVLRQAQDAFADDVLLDLTRARRDRDRDRVAVPIQQMLPEGRSADVGARERRTAEQPHAELRRSADRARCSRA